MITKALASDAEALNRLVNSAYRGATSRQGWTTEADLLDGTRIDADAILQLIVDDQTEVLKYVENDRILGCVELKTEGDAMYLGMLTVAPNCQGKGIGKKILETSEEWAKARSCSSVYMTVLSDRNELIKWYERCGYVDTGERKPFSFTEPRFGQPKKPLTFMVLKKKLTEP